MLLRPDQARLLANVLLAADEDGLVSSPPEDGRPASAPASPSFIGRYRVTRLIGHGGMGAVYEAQQEHPARRVALKVVRAELVSPELARRLDHEARVLGRLEHPGIARIYEAGNAPLATGDTPYFAMEYVEGKPLTEHVKEHKLSLKDRLELFLAVCDAVEHAHRRGIIHRDLKPGNILVDTEGKPRVLDFGLARATDADVRATTIHTEVGKLVGTLPYMSPEQVSGDSDAIDTRSDVYALGVVLYEMLAGKPPYQVGRGAIAEAARIIRDTEPAPLSSIDRVFRGDLDVIALKALAKEKERRYQSVSDMAGDVRRYVRREPIEARRAGSWYHVRRFAARNKPVVIAVSSIAIVLIVATGVSLVSAVRARDARDLARSQTTHAERRAAIAKGVVDFMQDVFAGATPEENDGRDLPVSEMLHRATERLDSGAVQNRSVEAHVRSAIGATLLSLGRFADAEKQLRKGWEACREADGDDHPDTIRAMSTLGQALHDAGRTTEAEDLLRRAARHAERLPAEHRDVWAHSLQKLASLLADTRRAPDAEGVYRLALQTAEHAPGMDPLDVIDIRNSYAVCLFALERYDESLAMQLKNYQDLRGAHGESDPRTLITKANIAMIYQRTNRLEDAEPMLRQVFEGQSVLLGESHPDTLSVMNSLARLLYRRESDAEAEALFRRCLELRSERLGPGHPDTLATIGNLAMLLERSRRLDEALSVAQDGARLAEEHHGRDHMATCDQRARVARIYQTRGELDRAEEVLLGIESVQAAPGSATARWLSQTRSKLADLYEAWGKPEEAAAWRDKVERVPEPTNDAAK